MSKKNPVPNSDLENLVEELMKDKPNQGLIKKLSQKLGFPYSKNLYVQMNTVLESATSLDLQSPQREIGK